MSLTGVCKVPYFWRHCRRSESPLYICNSTMRSIEARGPNVTLPNTCMCVCAMGLRRRLWSHNPHNKWWISDSQSLDGLVPGVIISPRLSSLHQTTQHHIQAKLDNRHNEVYHFNPPISCQKINFTTSYYYIPLGQYTSAYDGEVHAIKVALQQLTVHLDKFNNAIILSDSRATIQSISQTFRPGSLEIKDSQDLLQEL